MARVGLIWLIRGEGLDPRFLGKTFQESWILDPGPNQRFLFFRLVQLIRDFFSSWNFGNLENFLYMSLFTQQTLNAKPSTLNPSSVRD